MQRIHLIIALTASLWITPESLSSNFRVVSTGAEIELRVVPIEREDEPPKYRFEVCESEEEESCRLMTFRGLETRADGYSKGEIQRLFLGQYALEGALKSASYVGIAAVGAVGWFSARTLASCIFIRRYCSTSIRHLRNRVSFWNRVRKSSIKQVLSHDLVEGLANTSTEIVEDAEDYLKIIELTVEIEGQGKVKKGIYIRVEALEELAEKGEPGSLWKSLHYKVSKEMAVKKSARPQKMAILTSGFAGLGAGAAATAYQTDPDDQSVSEFYSLVLTQDLEDESERQTISLDEKLSANQVEDQIAFHLLALDFEKSELISYTVGGDLP